MEAFSPGAFGFAKAAYLVGASGISFPTICARPFVDSLLDKVLCTDHHLASQPWQWRRYRHWGFARSECSLSVEPACQRVLQRLS